MSCVRSLYTDHHAASLVRARMVGQLYEPSNGEEGDRFESLFCNQCRHRGVPEEGTGCEISLRAYWILICDPRYPREWIYGLDGQPTCTAFAPDDGE